MSNKYNVIDIDDWIKSRQAPKTKLHNATVVLFGLYLGSVYVAGKITSEIKKTIKWVFS